MPKLTAKQEMFCREYLIDLNATQAAIRAGYSKNTAQRMGSENLSKPVISERVKKLMSERSDRVEINADYVLNRLVAIDKMDVKDILNDEMGIKPISEWPEVWRISISGTDVTELKNENEVIGLIKKIKFPDKLKNLELLGRHFKMFTDKVELDGKLVVKTTRKRFDGSE